MAVITVSQKFPGRRPLSIREALGLKVGQKVEVLHSKVPPAGGAVFPAARQHEVIGPVEDASPAMLWNSATVFFPPSFPLTPAWQSAQMLGL